ncbi:NADH dehydrogenase [ubiquinone] 1 alpha subcomplex subunit 8 [Colletes latitarsis]|uniref:NADH dehydrogenase [ubiquinone] 1 alpha subcomplex subunit 8 n=1 Tax=Colletes latitarsis TaxID=2605962 RepID=UPI004036B0A7
MVVTKTTLLEIPSDEELTVQEINVSWPLLQAASFYLGKKCERENLEFTLCKQELDDPRKCYKDGLKVTACALEVFQGIKKHCADDFNRYVKCIERSSGTFEFSKCRETQVKLDKCMLENLQIERPPFGYFCEAKVHNTPRPPAPPKYEDKVYPDTSPKVVQPPYPPSKFGLRSWWSN